MILRICLIVAIVAGLGTGVVSYLEISDKIPALQKQRDDEHTAKVNEITAHGKTKTELKKTQGELAQTQQELTDTKGERDKAVARADAQSKRAEELAAEIRQLDTILRTFRPGDARLDGREIEFEDVGELGLGGVLVPEEAGRLALDVEILLFLEV